VQAIPDLLRRAIHYETEAPRVAKRGCEGVPPVHGHVRVGETLYRVKITVRKQTNGLRFYDQHSVEMADPDVVSAAQDSRRATSAVHPAAGSTSMWVICSATSTMPTARLSRRAARATRFGSGRARQPFRPGFPR
jgi:hypothetical protein